jgi:ssRNA-specific RNase YbeY (16S rRNA maturation enzyme)
MKSVRNYKNNFSITRLAKNTPKINGVFFGRIKDKILGKNYELSLVFTTKTHSQKLNRLYRKKNKAANVLSFLLSPNAGEIFLSPLAKKETVSLFIHGLCHLKGLSHGSKMDSEEKRFRKLFNITNS